MLARPLGVAAIGAAILTSVAACTLVADIDVCEREGAPALDVNGRNEGDQQVAAVAALPSGNALGVFFSTAVGDTRPLSELRATLIGGDGTPLPTCDAAGLRETTLLTRRIIGSVSIAPPAAASERGLMVWLERADETSARTLQGVFFSGTGCLEAAPFEIARSDASYEVLAPSALPTGDNQFVIVWGELENARANGRIRARAVEFSFTEPEWLDNVVSGRGDAMTLVDSARAVELHVTLDGDGTFALAWYNLPFPRLVGFARFGRGLATLLPPVSLAERRTDESSPDVTGIRIAHAGAAYLVAYARRDETGIARVVAQRLDARGVLSAGPLGSGARLGTRSTARELVESVAALDDGGFAVSFTEETGTTDGADRARDVRAVLLDGAGARRFANASCSASDFELSGDPRGLQERALLVAMPGGLLAAWSDDGGHGNDASGYGVRSRFFAERALLPIE